MKFYIFVIAFFISYSISAQVQLTPESLWKIGRVTGLGLTNNKTSLVYAVSTPNMQNNSFSRDYFQLSLLTGKLYRIQDGANVDTLLPNDRISPDGKYLIFSEDTLVKKVFSKDIYKDLPLANAYIYNSLNYRHWDTWEDGKFSHVFYKNSLESNHDSAKDIMANEAFDCPQKPYGGGEDFIWNPDSKHIVYVCKKKFGTDYAKSTNTDLYQYDLTNGTTTNLTNSNIGYDVSPAYNNKGVLAWLQMKRDGYESDKQDLVFLDGNKTINLTGHRDDLHVESFKWSLDDKSIFFTAPTNGTIQLFKVNINSNKLNPIIKQLTNGDFDITGIIGQADSLLIVSRTDMNHASELYSLNLISGVLNQLTHVNDNFYKGVISCPIQKKLVTTTDDKKMVVWVIYPPYFDSTKKYPSILYCQGGPQVSLTQFYSFRWNLQLMASQGYIVIAPCRRGMPGFGTKWNEDVSKDWGGQVIKDYLSAVDAVSQYKFIDKNRRACVGASFGGFSVFALAGCHNGRFKSFIAHDGIFDFRSMYGTTDEVFFENWEKGGHYWEKGNNVAMRSFSQSPSNYVEKWNTPIFIIQGGKDYRVSIEQGQQAFQAAQLRGIKSKFLYLPEENHWVLSPQNSLLWQREFYKWLKETVPE